MYTKKTQSPVQRKKAQFRQTAKWKKFRLFMKKECKGVDLITQKKLYKGYQLHHKDMSIEHYKQLEPDRFICLNKSTHEFIHWAFVYYQIDKEFLKRVEKLLDEMCELNKLN